MHSSAMNTAKAFFAAYADKSSSVLEVGSLNINGSMREAAEVGTYWGVDMVRGLGVDQVLSDPYSLPFDDCAYDISVSSSCLEHDPMFWLTFGEMCRIAKKFIYVSAPVQGPIHRHPVDCWRFYPDAGGALALWARRLGHDVKLVESFLHPPRQDVWCDFVAVFAKDGAKAPDQLVSDCFPFLEEVRRL